MNEIYFENVVKVGNLFLEKVFNKFEDENIIFICQDIHENRYLCICYEFRFAMKWILCRISPEMLVKLLTKREDMRSVFEVESKEWIRIVYQNGDEESEIISMDSVDANILPRHGVFLKADQENANYLKFICFHYLKTTTIKCCSSVDYRLNRQKSCMSNVLDRLSSDLVISYNLRNARVIGQKENLLINLNDAA